MPDRFSNPAAERGASAPSRKEKELFLRKWFSDPQTYPDEFKAWLRSSLVADPNITWEVPQIPKLPGSKIIADSITSAQLAPDSVGPSEIATDAVGSAEIIADAVGASELADNSVDTAAIIDAAVTFAKLGTWTWAHFGGMGNYAAGGDKNYRDFTNCTVSVDVRSSNFSTWLTASSNLRWQFPQVGKYLVIHDLTIGWQVVSEIGGVIFDDTTGNSLFGYGVSAYVTAGNDAFGISKGISVAGIVDITSTLQAHTFHPGGYTGAGGNVGHWVTAIRLPI